MSTQQDLSTRQRHVIASIGNILLLTGLPMLFCCSLIVATADVGGPLNLIIIPCANCAAATITTVIVFFPISTVLERELRRIRPEWQTRVFSLQTAGVLFTINLILIVAGFLLVLGVILENALALHIVGDFDRETVVVGLVRVLFLGGIPLLLGGTMYWFLLRASNKLQLGHPQMKTCIHCNERIPFRSLVCSHCGREVDAQSSAKHNQ
jgi:hypothetical protein